MQKEAIWICERAPAPIACNCSHSSPKNVMLFKRMFTAQMLFWYSEGLWKYSWMMLWSRIFSQLYLQHPTIPFWFFLLVLAVGATMWPQCLGLQRMAALLSPLPPFHLLVFVLDWCTIKGLSVPLKKLKAGRQVSSTIYLYHRRRVHVHVFKITFQAVIDVFLIVE